MKTVLGVLAVVGFAATANADIVLNATQTNQWSIGQPGATPSVVPLAIYSNVDTFSGQALLNGGATLQGTNTITRLIADDITPVAHGPGDITRFDFNVANLNSTVVSARARVRFYADNAGAPGTLLGGFTFNPIAFAANSVTTYFTTLAPGAFLDFTGTIWAGMTYDNNNGATLATAAQLDNLGMGIFNPVDVGSSTNVAFRTTAAGSNFANNPAGSILTPGPLDRPLNLGWAFVPAPGSVALVGLGGLMAARRRR